MFSSLELMLNLIPLSNYVTVVFLLGDECLLSLRETVTNAFYIFRVYEADFVDEMIRDPGMVKLMEECNFCVPSPDSYRGPSYFFGNPTFSP